jgi:hypothetical protein
MPAMTMLTAISSFLGNPNKGELLRRPEAGEAKDRNGARGALPSWEVTNFMDLGVRNLCFGSQPGCMPSAQGSPKRGEKEATLAAVADLCFCQGT